MKKNPRLEDEDKKGRFLSFKNFAWGGMSGCDGYGHDFRAGLNFALMGPDYGNPQFPDKIVLQKANQNQANVSHKASVFKSMLKITGVSEAVKNKEIDRFRIWGWNESEEFSTTKDGIYNIDLYSKEGQFYFMARGTTGTNDNPQTLSTPIIIEELPSYPGFIISDGVDDHAVTEKNLDFEDTYTVYTAFIPFESTDENPPLCGKQYNNDFYIYYKGYTLNAMGFYSSGRQTYISILNGFNLCVCKRNANKLW